MAALAVFVLGRKAETVAERDGKQREESESQAPPYIMITDLSKLTGTSNDRY